MTNDNNSYVQNSSMNIRKDNDDWCRAVDTVDVSEVADLVDKTITENGTYAASDDGVSGYSSVSVDVPTEDPYVYLVYGSFSGGGPMGPGTLNMSAGYLGVLKVDDGNAVVDCVPRKPSGTEIVISHIIINGTVNTINITRHSYPVSVSFKAGADISEFTVQGTTVVPTGTEITAGNWYNALIQRVNGTETVTVEMNDNLERTVVTPQQ
jgi:hypothetical protein